jgi:hypothetical protein
VPVLGCARPPPQGQACERRYPVKLATRKRLVELVQGGLDVEAAAAEAGVKMAEIQADAELVTELEQAFRGATAKLRARLLHRVLQGDDDKLLAAALDRREAGFVYIQVYTLDWIEFGIGGTSIKYGRSNVHRRDLVR